MAFTAKVEDTDSFKRFVDNLESSNSRVQEVLRRIGKYNNPTEAQKEMYLKWANLWKFSHEMILQAADDTINANNPSFGYIDAILTGWQEAGIATPKDLKETQELEEAVEQIEQAKLEESEELAEKIDEAVREQNIKKGGVGDVWLENLQSRGHARWY